MLFDVWALDPFFQIGAATLTMKCALFCLLFTWIPIAARCFMIEFDYFKIGAFEVQLFLEKTMPDKLALETLMKVRACGQEFYFLQIL